MSVPNEECIIIHVLSREISIHTEILLFLRRRAFRGAVCFSLDPMTVLGEAKDKDGKRGVSVSVVDYLLSIFDSVLQDRQKH